MSLTTKTIFLILVAISIQFELVAQSIIINEVSNGTNTKEYVELVVTGPVHCDQAPDSIDIRNWIIDDNNGYFSASSSGTGVAPGVCRFSSDPFWSNIPTGTLIVIYNSADKNDDIPADDYSMDDGNCRLVLPISSTLFERNDAQPNSTTSAYPTGGWVSGGDWNTVAMSNSNDSYQVRDPLNMAVPVHSVSYANNNLNNFIYFNMSGSSTVFYFENTVDDDPYNQSSWTFGSTTANNNNNGTHENGVNDQTPGYPNSINNENWIVTLNHNCTLPPTVYAGEDDTICGGTTNLSAVGGGSTAIYTWSDGSSGQNIVVSPSVTTEYVVTMTENGWCVFDTVSVVVEAGFTINLSANNPSSCGSADGTITISGLNPNETYELTYNDGSVQGPNNINSNASGELIINGLSAGNFTNFVVGQAGCSDTDNTVITLVEPSAPTVDAGSNQTICEGTNVTLTATNPDGATISWDNGINDGIAFTPSVGTVTYTVTADLAGCISTDQVDIIVNVNPTVNAGADQTLCEGDNTSLTATNPNGAIISWDNSITDGTVFTPSIGTTTYTVTASLAGCISTDQTQIIVNPNPILDAGTNQALCDGDNINLTASNPDGAVITWDNGIVDGNPFTPPLGTQTYTVTAVLLGCSVSDQVNVTVNPYPNIDAGTDQTLCEGDNTTLTATNPDGATISWDNSITDGSVFTPSIGTTTYTATANLASCISTDQVQLTVNPAPSFNLNSINPSACGIADGSIIISNLNANENYILTYNNGTAQGPDNITSSSTGEYTINNLSAGSYSNISIEQNGCATTDNTIINLTEPNAPTIDAGSNFSVCEGSNITLTASNPDGASISWDNGITDGLSFTPTIGLNTYTVTANLAGCVGTDQIQVTVNPLPIVNAGANQTLCEGETATLTAINPDGAIINWDNGINDAVAFMPNLGTNTYTVTASLLGCISSDQTQITVNALPNIDAGNDISLCEGETVILSASNPDGAVISWDHNITDGLAFIPTIGSNIYTATADLFGCSNSDQIEIIVNILPTVDAGNDQSICEGENLTLTASNPDGASITWNNSVIDGQNFTPALGSNTYVVNANLNGCLSNDSITINVAAITPVNAGNDTTICQGDGIFLQATGGSSNASYIWSHGITNSMAYADPIQNTLYTVSMTDNGCTATDAVWVLINETATVSLGNDLNICEGESVTLTVNGSSTSLNYIWSNGATSESITVQPTISTSYTVSISDNICASSDDITVNVHPNPNPNISNPDKLCEGDTVKLYASSGNFTYNWNTGSTDANINIHTGGFYSVSVYDSYGCNGSASVNIQAYPKPDIDIFASDLEGCSPLTVNFNSISTCDTCSYLWKFDGSSQPNEASVSHTFNQAGTYNVKHVLTNTDGCSNSANMDIHVFPVPEADFVANPQIVDVLNPEVSFINYSEIETNETLRSYWDFDDGFSSSAYSTKHIYQSTGEYLVSLTVVSDHNCSDSIFVPVTVEDAYLVYFPNAISPQSTTFENRFFYPKGIGANTDYFEIIIYDRWGENIFKSRTFPEGFSQREVIEGGWNGRYNNTGKYVQPDLYLWIVNIMDHRGVIHEYSGTVTVIR